MPLTPEQQRRRNLLAVKRYQAKPEIREKTRERNRRWSMENRRQPEQQRAEWLESKYSAIADRLEALADSPDFIGRQYLAGFTDGEGWIGAMKIRGRVVGMAGVANCDHHLLRRLHGQFGCGTLHLAETGATPKCRPFGRLVWHARNALFVLEWILPYLIIKRPQALLCIELVKMRDTPIWQRWDKGVLRPEYAAREDAIFHQLRALNARGPRIL